MRHAPGEKAVGAPDHAVLLMENRPAACKTAREQGRDGGIATETDHDIRSRPRDQPARPEEPARQRHHRPERRER